MYNEFYYTKVHVDPPTEKGAEPKITVLDGCSFPLDNVEESIALPDGRRAIILKGGHEETQTQVVPGKNGKIIETRERKWVRREIYLSPEDAARYRKVTERVVLLAKENPYGGLVTQSSKQEFSGEMDKRSGEAPLVGESEKNILNTIKNPE